MNWNAFIQNGSNGDRKDLAGELPRKTGPKVRGSFSGMRPPTRFPYRKIPPIIRFPFSPWSGVTVLRDRYGNEPPPKTDKPASEPGSPGSSNASGRDAQDASSAPPQSSEYISWVQNTLNQVLNLRLAVDGIMKPEVRSAVRSFQQQQGLPVDGIVGPETERSLIAASRGRTPAASAEFEAFDVRLADQEWQGEGNGSISNYIGWIRQAAIHSALRAGNEQLAMRFAISTGITDENKLTDVVFFFRHPERQERRLERHEQQLILEWLKIRNQLVRPALQASTIPGSPAAPSQSQTAAQTASTTSGVEAAGVTTRIIPCILGLQAQGRSISFVVRYLRDLKRAEVISLSNNGLRIVSCYELTSSTGVGASKIAYYSRAQGRHDGRLGFTQAQAVGQTSETPIYFAVDTDPGLQQRQVILDYFEGIQDGYNQYLADMQAQSKPAIPYAIGVYGSGCVLSWCQTQGIATWFWQAFAPGWCNNRKIWPGANIHTSGRDEPIRCGWKLGRLEGWGNEGAW